MGLTPTNQTIVIHSRLAEVGPVVTAIVADVKRYDYSEDDIFVIRLSLDEAISNAIRHGNHSDPAKQVTVQYQISSRQCRVKICDQGCGFCPGRLPDPTLDENLERPNGRGVMLMKAYMNQVSYNTQGNCVTLVKKRLAPPGTTPGTTPGITPRTTPRNSPRNTPSA